MAKPLLRFYDINSGAISVDGHNIQDFSRYGDLTATDESDIVVQGIHEALLEKKGFYASVYYSQFEEADIY